MVTTFGEDFGNCMKEFIEGLVDILYEESKANLFAKVVEIVIAIVVKVIAEEVVMKKK